MRLRSLLRIHFYYVRILYYEYHYRNITFRPVRVHNSQNRNYKSHYKIETKNVKKLRHVRNILM